MLLDYQLKEFFERYSLPLCEEKKLSPDEVTDLFLAASNMGYSFSSFILWGVLNINRDGISTCFNSWNELYDAYCDFMTGFMQVSGQPNN